MSTADWMGRHPMMRDKTPSMHTINQIISQIAQRFVFFLLLSTCVGGLGINLATFDVANFI